MIMIKFYLVIEGSVIQRSKIIFPLSKGQQKKELLSEAWLSVVRRSLTPKVEDERTGCNSPQEVAHARVCFVGRHTIKSNGSELMLQ